MENISFTDMMELSGLLHNQENEEYIYIHYNPKMVQLIKKYARIVKNIVQDQNYTFDNYRFETHGLVNPCKVYRPPTAFVAPF